MAILFYDDIALDKQEIQNFSVEKLTTIEIGALTSGQGTTVANVFWDANGYGQLVVSLSDGGCPVSDTLVVGHQPLGVFDLLSEQTKVSPNPSSGIFTINVPHQTNIQASVLVRP